MIILVWQSQSVDKGLWYYHLNDNDNKDKELEPLYVSPYQNPVLYSVESFPSSHPVLLDNKDKELVFQRCSKTIVGSICPVFRVES